MKKTLMGALALAAIAPFSPAMAGDNGSSYGLCSSGLAVCTGGQIIGVIPTSGTRPYQPLPPPMITVTVLPAPPVPPVQPPPPPRYRHRD